MIANEGGAITCKFINGVEASTVMQWIVNPPVLTTPGSIPGYSTRYIRVAQLDRATVYETVGWGLVSLRGYHIMSVAWGVAGLGHTVLPQGSLTLEGQADEDLCLTTGADWREIGEQLQAVGGLGRYEQSYWSTKLYERSFTVPELTGTYYGWHLARVYSLKWQSVSIW